VYGVRMLSKGFGCGGAEQGSATMFLTS